MKIEVLKNGNLLLIAAPGDELDGERGYWQAMADLFEPYATNGGFAHFDAGQGNPFVGLTGAPCIAERLDVDDEGHHSIDGRLWVFNDYMLDCDLELLRTAGRVEYQLVGHAQ